MRAALSFITLGLALTTCTPLQTGTAPDASACDAPCTLGRTCVAGRCTAAVCVTGRANCDRDESNGCEVSTATNALHCGACGRACALPGATAVCVAGVCRIGACTALRGDCDEDPTNGCETDLATDTAHCGTCATSCTRSHATVECSAGACETTACETGFADCDGLGANGCEADLTTSLAHCGACESPCPAPVHGIALCTARTCASACDTGYERTTGACLSRGAPRLVAPLSANVVSSHRPTLRWALGAATRGAVITLCRDRALTRECQTHSALGTSLQLPSPLARGVWFWNARGHDGAASLPAASLTWSFVVGARDTVATGTPTLPCDLDGDGFEDIALGADTAAGSAGRVHVFHGGPAGLTATASRSLDGTDALGQFGVALARGGDVNGDGYGDLIVGAPYATVRSAPAQDAAVRDLPQAGKVFVFHGASAGVGPRAATTLEGTFANGALGRFVSVGADIDGDGYADLLVNAHNDPEYAGSIRVHRGGPNGVNRAVFLQRDGIDGVDTGYGHVTSIAGDLNRDGSVDLVVTATGVTHNTGRVYVYFGEPGGTVQMIPVLITGPGGPQGVFGWSLARRPPFAADLTSANAS